MTIIAPSFGPVIAESAHLNLGLNLNFILIFWVIILIAAATRLKQRKAELMAKAVQSVSFIDPVK